MTESILIIGGGIVGLATAYRLLGLRDDLRLTVLEKETSLGQHQSTHNSGVLHAGLYYKPGSAKARLAVRGIRQMTAFCKEHGIAHEICGKLVVATNAKEAERLTSLMQRGSQNGLQGLRLLSSAELREVEPHVAGVAGIHVPEEGIVNYAGVVKALAEKIKQRGGTIVTGAEAKHVQRDTEGWIVTTANNQFKSDFLLNTGGLHSDRICRMAGADPQSKIIPFRGEYYKLRSKSQHLVRNLIYPVPNPEFPFLGVHFTRLITGGIEAGPNAVLALAREGYRKSDIGIRDTFETVTYTGFLRFVKHHFKMCVAETLRSHSSHLFCRSLQTLIPAITVDDLEPGGAGVRAQALNRAGSLVDDFHLIPAPRALHVVNAPSPAATASLAIGEEIAATVAKMRSWRTVATPA